jgi:assimilatory nitrate reductase catalytic subunit
MLTHPPASSGVATHCPYCALQCATFLHPTPGGPTPVRIDGRDFTTNRGGLCQKGWTAGAVLNAPDRLTTPLLRDQHGTLRPTGWATALDVVAERVLALQAEHGPESIGVFGGGGLTNEKAYALGKFARVVLRTPNIDYNGRFCMSSAAAAGLRAFGVDRGLPFPLADLGAAQSVLLVGSNIAETMPPAARAPARCVTAGGLVVTHLAGARAAGGLVVVDPRRTPTATLADDGAGIHLQLTPGTDLALLLGMMHVAVHEELLDATFLATRTIGFDQVLPVVNAWWPERTEAVTGVPASLLRDAVRLLALGAPSRGGGGAYVLTGRGAEQHTKGTDTVTAAVNLALALGLPGRLGSGYGCITGQGNGQGGREHGQKADQLPGYRRIDDPVAREHVARVWGVDPRTLPGPGRAAVELLGTLGGRFADGSPGLRGLFVHGSNVAVSAPRSARVRERLGALDLLVVCDVVPSETAELADVVLPVTQWAEEGGTMTSLEGRVVRRRPATAAPPGVRSDLDVLAALSDRLAAATAGIPKGAIVPDPDATYDELRRASRGGPADYSGITLERLDAGEALFWPCPQTPADAPDHPGTPRLFLDRFGTPDGCARLVAVQHRAVDDDLRADAATYLVTGRVLAHYQSGAQTRRVPELVDAEPSPYAELHPDLAERLSVEDGDRVDVTSSRGRSRATVRITDSVRPDTVFMAFHWPGEGSVNRVTNDAVDPVSGMPEFKVCAVDVTRVLSS